MSISNSVTDLLQSSDGMTCLFLKGCVWKQLWQ